MVEEISHLVFDSCLTSRQPLHNRLKISQFSIFAVLVPFKSELLKHFDPFLQLTRKMRQLFVFIAIVMRQLTQVLSLVFDDLHQLGFERLPLQLVSDLRSKLVLSFVLRVKLGLGFFPLLSEFLSFFNNLPLLDYFLLLVLGFLFLVLVCLFSLC